MAFRGSEPVDDIDPDTGLPRTIFLIPVENREKFERQMATLSRRSERLIGLPIKPVFFGRRREKDEATGDERLLLEVFLTAETPKLNGWTFMARLDHANETGTVIRGVPNTGRVPESYRHSEPDCDHCSLRRKRRDTFLLRCDEGEDAGTYRQVGASCLKDFFGHDPYKIARLAEMLGYADEIARGYSEWEVMSDRRFFGVEGFLIHCMAMIRLHGWVSAKEAREATDGRQSTASRATYNMMWQGVHETEEVTDEDRALAAEALEWVRGFEAAERQSDWEHNVLVIATAEMMEFRSAGLVASIAGSYTRRKAREAREAGEPRGESLRVRMARSAFVGKEKERLRDLPATIIGYKLLESELYGVTHLYRFITEGDAVLVWFATSEQSFKEGDKVLLTGTVKKHEPREGVAQTVLSRCILREPPQLQGVAA